MSTNPYERIYDELNIAINEETTFEEAQHIAKHLGFIYNTFGVIVKDFITMLGYKFKSEDPQHSMNINKKEKKNIVKDAKNDKKTKLDEKSAQQQLEGKNKTPPHSRLIKEIQNYRSSDIHNLARQQQVLKSKLLQLRQEKKVTPQQSNEKIINTQQNQQQPQSQTKISFKKKNTQNVVINISSEDEQKEDDQTNGVKTRAQLRGVAPRIIERPQKPLARGRGRRGRPRKIRTLNRDEESSNQSSEDKSKRGSSYPLDPNDPFTIIYNVPYNPKNLDSQSMETVGVQMSKKEQKNQKRLHKRDSQIGSSSVNSDEEEQKSQKVLEREKLSNTNHYYNNQKFIDKVKASYMLEKQAIKERLQNLQKEYEYNKAKNKMIIGGERKLQVNSDEQQFDQYNDQMEQEQEQEIQEHSQQGQHQQQNDDQRQQQQQYEIVQQHEQKIVRSNMQVTESFDEQGVNMKQKEIHLQWLNNSIQQEFEENLRMNQNIHEDEYQDEVYLMNEQQNDDMSFRGQLQDENYAEQSFENNKAQQVNRQQQMHQQQFHNSITNAVNNNPDQQQFNEQQQLHGINQQKNNKIILENNHQYEVEIDHITNNQQFIHQGQQQANHTNTNNHNKNTDQVLRVLEEFESDEDDEDQYANIEKDEAMIHQNTVKNSEYIPISSLISKKIGELGKSRQGHLQLHDEKAAPMMQKINRSISTQQPRCEHSLNTGNLNQQQSSINLSTLSLTNQHKEQEQKKYNSNQYIIYTKKSKPIEIIQLE